VAYKLTIQTERLVQRKSLKIPKGGNQNPYIEEEQKTHSPKEVQKDKQRSTKHTHKTKDQGILGNGIFCLFGNFLSTKILGKLLYLLIALILMLLSILLFITTLRTSIQCHIFISVYLDYWSQFPNRQKMPFPKIP
jgi:hypothetical protein